MSVTMGNCSTAASHADMIYLIHLQPCYLAMVRGQRVQVCLTTLLLLIYQLIIMLSHILTTFFSYQALPVPWPCPCSPCSTREFSITTLHLLLGRAAAGLAAIWLRNAKDIELFNTEDTAA